MQVAGGAGNGRLCLTRLSPRHSLAVLLHDLSAITYESAEVMHRLAGLDLIPLTLDCAPCSLELIRSLDRELLAVDHTHSLQHL